MSDIVRWLLLYQYGGLWLDSTILVLRPLPKEIFEYSLFTRREQYKSFGADTGWSMFFIGARPGHKLFEFLSAMLLLYIRDHRSIMDMDYLMSDYIIGIAYNTYPEIRRDFGAIPVCGSLHSLKPSYLVEPYSAEKFDLHRGADWCKTSYRVNWGNKSLRGSVYEYICENF